LEHPAYEVGGDTTSLAGRGSDEPASCPHGDPKNCGKPPFEMGDWPENAGRAQAFMQGQQAQPESVVIDGQTRCSHCGSSRKHWKNTGTNADNAPANRNAAPTCEHGESKAHKYKGEGIPFRVFSCRGPITNGTDGCEHALGWCHTHHRNISFCANMNSQ
jgi:hypothetical protein